MADIWVTFDQPIGDWDVSSVTNMNGMFFQASAFNQPIGDWNVGQVTDMTAMFNEGAFNQPIDAWAGQTQKIQQTFGSCR